MKVFLAGEGATELGRFADHPSYRDGSSQTGVIEALLRRVRGDGWSVVDGIKWTRIRKYRAGEHASPEARNVRGAAREAREKGADVLAFTRDRDRDPQRQADLEDGIQLALADTGSNVRIVGGMAVEEIESWILSLRGERDAEKHADAKTRLRSALDGENQPPTRESMLEAIDKADFGHLPADAASLRIWIDRARAALSAPTG